MKGRATSPKVPEAGASAVAPSQRRGSGDCWSRVSAPRALASLAIWAWSATVVAAAEPATPSLDPTTIPAPPAVATEPALAFVLAEPALPQLTPTNTARARLQELVADLPATNHPLRHPGEPIGAHGTNADEALSSPNLLPLAKTDPQWNEAQRVEFLQTQLELARQQRRQKDFGLATKHLTSVLRAEAPEELHRAALLELAFVAQDEKHWARAQQIFARYLTTYPQHPSVPEIILRQGLLYREMGAMSLAIAKFYAVMTSAVNVKQDHLEYYERLVLQAQTEIADTYLIQGRFEDAAEFFQRLVRRESPHLNHALVHYKLVQSLAAAGKRTDTIAQANRFLESYPEAPEVPEVRFLLATAYRQAGLDRDALRQVLQLLETQHNAARQNPEAWAYWQKRAGNDIANQLYAAGDFENTLMIYQHLARLDNSPAWQIPVWYQIGLVYERQLQPAKAAEVYTRILDAQKELTGTRSSPSLQSIVEMARWRKDSLGWIDKIQAAQISLRSEEEPTSN